jgi:hypothetical protein
MPKREYFSTADDLSTVHLQIGERSWNAMGMILIIIDEISWRWIVQSVCFL